MVPTLDSENKTTMGLLAGGIALLLVLGVFAVVSKSGDDGPSPEELAQEQAEQEQQQQQDASEEAQVRAQADQQALATIESQLEACRTKYLPEASQRAEVAKQHLKELEDTLNRVAAQLPPGRAKDTLLSQLGPDVASANQLIDAEQRSLETRCKMAFTIFQYTRESPPVTPPPPG